MSGERADERAGERPAVLLAAHGERGGAANNARLAALAAEVGALVPEADVGSVLVSVEGLVARTLEACGTRPVVCLPLLFSDGYFYTDRLKPHFDGRRQRLAQPLAFWPGFAPFLADNLALRLISHSADPRVVLVAHGSKQPGKSAEAARRVAGQLQARYGRVEAAFLEEVPFARDVVARIEPPYAAIGLFFGAGLHGVEDFDVLVSTAAAVPAAAFTVGDLPGLAGLVADRARSLLADIRSS
jgi:sirohydrochlorin ferrochelatase